MLSSSDAKEQPKKISKAPPSRTCYVCGRMYGVNSYEIHIKQCKQVKKLFLLASCISSVFNMIIVYLIRLFQYLFVVVLVVYILYFTILFFFLLLFS